MTDAIASIIASLESGGGLFAGSQPQSMVDPTYGQYIGFTSQYGSGAAGVDNFAQQVLNANPSATLGQFYATYVLGTGNPANLASPAELQTLYPSAYNNLVKNAGVPLDTPLSQLLGASAPASGSGASTSTAANPGGLFGQLEAWIGAATGNVVFVIAGVVLLGGALIIFANQTPFGQNVRKDFTGLGAVDVG